MNLVLFSAIGDQTGILLTLFIMLVAAMIMGELFERSRQVPRGEVGIIVAQIGLGKGSIGDELYGVVLFMAVVTTLLAPPF